ncbi:LacI family DNA-binding transcriptional regulator [Nocardioides kribbensis]|uniref:LacI family DNA-binding transcriptional regulator n=1 Tax=Nocardioides kribbensis TaxID=305517 RepID=UPI0032DA281E
MPGPPRRAATIYDVAREAAVSISTVSNVLNKPERVARPTRERVLAVADELGYVPKSSAAHLARKRVGRIGVVAPFTAYPSYLQRLTGILRGASGQQLEVGVFDHESAATAATPLLASIPVRGAVDGLIVMGSSIEQVVEERLLAHGVPVVMVDADSGAFSVVTIDDFGAGRTAAQHLLDLGHRRLGYVLERQEAEYESQARRRLGGFREAVAEVSGATLEVVSCLGTAAAAEQVAAGMLAGGPGGRPTAVMAHFDDLALGVVRAARALALRVPDDVSVLGFDDGPVADAADLSTVHQPFEESGEVAVRLLLQAMAAAVAGAAAPQRQTSVLDCSLVQRASTAAP